MLKIYFLSPTLIKLKTCTKGKLRTHHTKLKFIVRSATSEKINYKSSGDKVTIELTASKMCSYEYEVRNTQSV